MSAHAAAALSLAHCRKDQATQETIAAEARRLEYLVLIALMTTMMMMLVQEWLSLILALRER